MIDDLKLENLDVFRKIEDNSKSFQELQGHIRENNLKTELRPTPLTIDTTFPEVKTYIRNFSNYIQSGNDKLDQLPEGLVFEIASNNADSFWTNALSSQDVGQGKLLFFEGFPRMTVFGEMIKCLNHLNKCLMEYLMEWVTK